MAKFLIDLPDSEVAIMGSEAQTEVFNFRDIEEGETQELTICRMDAYPLSQKQEIFLQKLPEVWREVQGETSTRANFRYKVINDVFQKLFNFGHGLTDTINSIQKFDYKKLLYVGAITIGVGFVYYIYSNMQDILVENHCDYNCFVEIHESPIFNFNLK